MTRKIQDPGDAVTLPVTAVTSANRGVGRDRRRLSIGIAASLSAHLLFVGWTAFDWGTRGVGIGEAAQNGASSSGGAAVSLTRLSANPATSAQSEKAAEPVKVAAQTRPVMVKARKPVTHSRPVHPMHPAPTTHPLMTHTAPVPRPSVPVPPTAVTAVATAAPAQVVHPPAPAPTNLAPSPSPTHSHGIAVLTAPESPFALATPESPRPAAPPPTEDDASEVSATPLPVSKVSPGTKPAVSASASLPQTSQSIGEGVSGASSNESAAPKVVSVTMPGSASAPGGASAGGSAPVNGAAASEGGQASGGTGRGVPFASAGGGGSVGPNDVRVAYVLDVSGSMKDDGKIDVARQALLQAVAGLRPSDRFTFILFSDRVKPLTTGLISAADTASVKQLEEKFVATVPYGETDLSDALDRALDLPGIQRIFLLSDGGPTLGIVDYDDLSDHIREHSHGGVRISTFAMGAGEQFEGVRLLRRIAEESGGDYRYVNVAPSSVAAPESSPPLR